MAVEVVETRGVGDATRIAREAYGFGRRRFIAVGGDGTSYEVVNGLFPEAGAGDRPTLGFLPLGTGNSFLRDFSDRGVEHAIESLIAGRTQACDVLRLRHRDGVIHYINLLSVGFPADVATLRARRFSGQGELGYVDFDFSGAGAVAEAAVSGASGRGNGIRPATLLVSHFQQQQVYRRDDDDRAEGGSEQRAD